MSKKILYRTKYNKKNKHKISNMILRLCILIFGIVYVYAFMKATGIENTGLQNVGNKNTEGQNIEVMDMEEALEEVEVNILMKHKEQVYCIIRCETAAGIQEIPLEDFLVLSLAANIDMQYEMETLKAQAVLLRGNCIRAAFEHVSVSTNSVSINAEDILSDNVMIDSDMLDFPFYSLEELKLIWGKKYDLYYQKAKEAVNQTQGIYAKSGSEILNGNFHAMSAGKTRSGLETLGNEAYDYLQSVPCNKNLEGENFFQIKYFEKSKASQLEILERDSAGYVTKVSWNGKSYSGEQVRETLGLASANFEIKNGEYCSITTKGIGHGFGFDQYYANYMAKEMKKDYMELVTYFYKDVSFSVLT